MGNQQCLCCEQTTYQNFDNMPQIRVTSSASHYQKQNGQVQASSSYYGNKNPSMVRNGNNPQMESQIRKPTLSYAVSEYLNRNRPFQAQMENYKGKFKQFGSLTYQGQQNHKSQPHGYGMLYYPNGNVYVGQFEQGMAQGFGHFIFNDGRFYKGTMKKNKADGEGQYESDVFYYKGGVKENLIQGQGVEKGKGYQFVGIYSANAKVFGTLCWMENESGTITNYKMTSSNIISNHTNSVQNKQNEPLSTQFQSKMNQTVQPQSFQTQHPEPLQPLLAPYSFSYTGNFSPSIPQLFHSQTSTFITPYGTYYGPFFMGEKHGRAEFHYKSGIKYVGQYSHNIKQGQGTLYSKSGTIAFCGQIKNGLPHGRGFVVNGFGDRVWLNWIEGIDQRLLENNNMLANTERQAQAKKEREREIQRERQSQRQAERNNKYDGIVL